MKNKNYLYIRTIDTWKIGKNWLMIWKDYKADCIVITNWKLDRTYPTKHFRY